MTRRAVALIACLPIAIGSFYVFAWLLGSAQQWSMSGAILPKTNMAVCQVLAGLSLLLFVTAQTRLARVAATALAVLVLAVGAATLVQHLASVDLGIDQIVATEPPGSAATMSPNRMGPPGASSLMLLGLALLALIGRRHRLAHGFAVVTGLVISVPIVGFLFGVRDFYSAAQFTGISWQTVIALFSITIGVLLATPEAGLAALARSAQDPGGRLLRRWLLPVVFVPLVAGWARTYFADRGLVDGANGTGLLILVLLIFMVFMLWQSASQVSKWSRRQRRATARFELLATTAGELLQSRDPQAAVDMLCRRVLDHLDCEIYLNYLHDRQTDRLRLNASAGIDASATARLEWLDVGAAVCGLVAREGTCRVVDRVQSDDDPRLAPIRALGIRAYACHPLTASDAGTFGTLSFGTRRRDGFAADEVALMRAVADQVATAMMRIRGEQMILRSERLFRQMADAAPAMLWIAEKAGSVTYRSRAWHEFTGIVEAPPADEGHNGAEGVHPEDQPRLRAALAAANDRREPFTLEYRLRRKDGIHRWVMDAGRPRWSEEGDFQGFVGSVIDIDDRRRVEDEARSLNTTLERRVVERTAELRRMTLELTRVEQRERDHLAELLHDGLQQLLVAAKLHVGLVVRAADQDREVRATQVTDLLQEALRSTRTLTVELSPPALRERGLVPALHWLAEWMHETHHLAVEVSAAEVPELLDATTRTLLFQCVRELLLNVVKYAGVKEAKIALSMRRGEELRIEVSDHGLGFDPAAVKDTAPTFGLASIRRRIDLVGGDVAIVAAPGEGARVTLTVPLTASASTEVSAAADETVVDVPPARTGFVPRVLLVDDHAMVRQGLAGILRDRRDLELVGEAADGLQAVELASALKPDVVIMDIRLPGIDGIEATRRLAERAPSCRVIGLSTYESAEKEAQMRAAGAVAYLTKDGPATTLIDTIRRVGSSRASKA